MSRFYIFMHVPVLIYKKWFESKLAIWNSRAGQVRNLDMNDEGFNLVKSATMVETTYNYEETTSSKWLVDMDPMDPERPYVYNVELRFDVKDGVVCGEAQKESFLQAFKTRFNIDDDHDYLMRDDVPEPDHCYYIYNFAYVN